MKIALAQINPTVGAVSANADRIIEFIERAAEQDADLVVFPELALVGYPPKDLLLKPNFIKQADAAMERIAAACTDIGAVVGHPLVTNSETGRELHNAASLLHKGRVVHTHLKNLLPTYDVFDESRYFEPADTTEPACFAGAKLGVSVCEDLWNDPSVLDRRLYHENPIDHLAAAGAELFINCSASPFELDKHVLRTEHLANAAKKHKLPIVYVNQVGGNDELIFDGASCVLNAEGELIARAKDFEEDLLVVDLPGVGFGEGATRPDTCGGVNWTADDGAVVVKGRIEKQRTEMEALYHALVLGLRDYCRKCGFKSLVLGLSGGIDSAVTAVIAAAALGGDKVTGVAMPSRYSSEGSKSDAQILAQNLGMPYHTVPIEAGHQALEEMIASALDDPIADLTEQNIQARVRGVTLMGLSNQLGAMLVTTGNKSELAVGYCTLYGDMAGGLAVLSDVPKTMVYDLARWMNTGACPLFDIYENAGAEGQWPIPIDSITKPPSAELKPDQVDQDSLPEYEDLDAIVEAYVERHESAAEIIEVTGLDAETVHRVIRLIDLNEYKRKQAAPGLKITSRAFGFGRRMPIAQRYDPRTPE